MAPVFHCISPADHGQTCKPQGTRWSDGKLYLTARHRGILGYDPETKQLRTLVYIYRNQLFKGPNNLDFDAEGNLFFTDPWGTNHEMCGPPVGFSLGNALYDLCVDSS